MEVGIVGLPNVGKSTLFNAITKAGAEVANYPFCTIEPNVGIAEVPDLRLDALSELYNPKKVTKAYVKFTDIAGLVKGASRGEGLGNKFLSHIKEVDALAHTVRCFSDGNIIREGKLDPLVDIETINMELILSDLENVENRISKVKNQKFNKAFKDEPDVLNKMKQHLNEGNPLRSLTFNEEELEIVKNLNLITNKPMLYVCNIDENLDESNIFVESVRDLAKKENNEVICLSAKLEEEIASLNEIEQKMFLEELGLKESGLDKFASSSYKLLNLITYFTVGEPEVRAWTIKNGIKAPSAAGVIHSDFERGYIRSEVIFWEDLIKLGKDAKNKGAIRIEGKEYIVKDGDVIHFLFNV